MASNDGKRAVTGGCHCGNIKYKLRLDPDNLEATRCNCTFCQKPGLTNFHVKDPKQDFELISPVDKSSLGNYQPNNKSADKWFCKDCGTHVYMGGTYSYEGQTISFFVVNLATVDQPQEGVDLSKAKLQYVDGLHDNWHAGPKSSAYSGGLP